MSMLLKLLNYNKSKKDIIHNQSTCTHTRIDLFIVIGNIDRRKSLQRKILLVSCNVTSN